MFHDSIIRESSVEGKINIIKHTLSLNKELLQKYVFVWDDVSPQYAIITEHIYYGIFATVLKRQFRKVLQNKPIVLFFAGECIDPDFNICDYAFTFNRGLDYDNRCCHVPIMLRYKDSIFSVANNLNSIELAKEELISKKGFCNFIYSNGKAHNMRDKLFYALSGYKNVDSLGKHLNNAIIVDQSIKRIQDWKYQSIQLKSKYKFSISAENAMSNGYVSEKILTSLQAHSVPIYWGSPSIDYEINDECFINAMKYDTLDELIIAVKKVDEDDELWCKMVSAPWFTDKQVTMHKKETMDYYSFLTHIFDSEIEFIKKTSEGFHPLKYQRSITTSFIDAKQIYGEMYAVMRKILK